MPQLLVAAESAESADAVRLQNALGDALLHITGSSGNAHFCAADAATPRGVFAVARMADGTAVGCGALRPFSGTTAEIKRVYAVMPHAGIGSAVLHFLEAEARRLGYTCVILETRRCNTTAVQFYARNGYTETPGYGIYAARPECVCFEKQL